jgi:hypothetical protein
MTTVAGRELDAEIARRVFRLHAFTTSGQTWWPEGERDGHCTTNADGTGGRFHLRHYSTDIAAAWQIIEHFQDAGWLVQLRCESDRDNYAADFFRFRDDAPDDETGDVFAPTMPLAICRAALAATDDGGGA